MGMAGRIKPCPGPTHNASLQGRQQRWLNPTLNQKQNKRRELQRLVLTRPPSPDSSAPFVFWALVMNIKISDI